MNAKSANPCPVRALPLEQYIDEKHGGNKSAFARRLKTENGTAVGRQQVTKWLAADCYVIECDEGPWLFHPTRSL